MLLYKLRLFVFALLPLLAAGSAVGAAADEAPRARLILAGDGGYADETALRVLLVQAQRHPEQTTIVLLGDNVYPDGIPSEANSAEERFFRRQLQALKETGAKLIVLPGNHDWGGQEAGTRRLQAQHAIVEEIHGSGVMLPEVGCPGPSVRKVGGAFTLVSLDSEALLRGDDYPAHCRQRSSREVAAALASLDSAGQVVLLTHHPLASFGPNSRLSEGCPMRMNCPRYLEMIDLFSGALRKQKPLVCAAGHDHTLQIISGDEVCSTYVVSGALSDTHQIDDNKRLIASRPERGFVLLEEKQSGAIVLTMITAAGDSPGGQAVKTLELIAADGKSVQGPRK